MGRLPTSGAHRAVRRAHPHAWGKLTDDDLDVINGNREQLEGRIQERYGYEKDRAKKDIDDWYGRQTW